MRRLLPLLIAVLTAAPAAAQSFTFRGFADVGGTTFTATDTFKAVLGSSSGVVFGGGVEAGLPHNLFVNLHASRFSKTGQRVFTAAGQTFPLGIEDTVTITPVEINGGYRFGTRRSRIVPYAAGGVSWHRLEETSTFAAPSENLTQTFTGYQILGGVEARIARWAAAAVEAQWTTVPNALGQNPSAVSTSFHDTDLGGTTIRAKFVVGSW